MKASVHCIAEYHLMVRFGDEIHPELTSQIAAACELIFEELGEHLVELVPSYTSIMLELKPLHSDPDAIAEQLVQLLAGLEQQSEGRGKLIELPVYYSDETGPDLASLAELHQLTSEQVIEIHSQREYQVCAIGFAPGFAFLASVDERIATPRHATPRLSIPAGSVGIANQQSAVYPSQSPGGWQIIGNCPLPLFDLERDPMMPFELGDKVRFSPVSRDEFFDLGGSLCQHWK